MKFINTKTALVIFVLFSTIMIGSTIDAYAVDANGRGSTGTGSVEACLNLGQPPNFSPCDTDAEWNGGNITNDASYKEGSSIPIRVDITGLETGAPWQKLVIGWDITKTQANTKKHTFDYITSFDRNDDPHPCLDALPLDVCENWVKVTKEIPQPGNLTASANTMNGVNTTTTNPAYGQPLTSFLNLPPNERLFTMFVPKNNTIVIHDIGYVSEGDPSNTGGNTEKTKLYVNYTSSSPHVIAAFGAHVASPTDWLYPATSVTGKSFQIECVEVKKNGGCDGGQINLDAFDVISPLYAPELTLVKNVTNNHGGNATAADFLLSASANGNTVFTASGNSGIGFVMETGVEYTLSENNLPGYEPTTGTWSCVGGGQFTSPNKIILSPNEKVTCSIENRDLGASLTVIKNVINNNGGTLVASNFTMNVNAVNPSKSIFAGNATGTTISIDAGAFSVTEDSVAGYSQVSAVGCTGTAVLGENYICTITNDDISPKLTIVKTVVNDNGGNKTVSDFPLFIDGNSVTNGTANNVTANIVHTASETNLTGYAASAWGGDCAADGKITLAPGDNKTCTITNDDVAPKLTIIKDPTNNDGGNALPDDFNLTVGGQSVLSGVKNSYAANTPLAINETQLTGYNFVSISGDAKCPAVLGGTITLDEGDDITCTITNDDVAPTLQLVKKVDTGDGGNENPNDFTLFANATSGSTDRDFSNAGGSGNFETVYANTPYQLSELSLDGYTASNWECTGGSLTENILTLEEGETQVICNIVNDDNGPSLKLTKTVINDNGGIAIKNDFTLFANATSGSTDRDFSNAGGSGNFETVYANTPYQLSESSVYGYAQNGQWSCNGGNLIENVITLTEGESGVTCTITNDDLAPQLTLTKKIINDNGGIVNAEDFTLTASGPTPISGSGFATSDSSFKAGIYTLTESGPSGYIGNVWICNEIPIVGNQITLSAGDSQTCEITNDDVGPGLTLQLVLNNGVDGLALPEDFTLIANHSSTGFFGPGPIQNKADVDAGNYLLSVVGPDSYSLSDWTCTGGVQENSTSVFLDLGESVLCQITIDFVDNCPFLENPDQLDSDNNGVGDACEPKGGDNQWDTRPTFGMSHEERATQIVDNGFAFNGDSFMVTDNHHTPFAQQSIEVGSLNSFAAKVWATKGLKVQEFLFGVPQTGMGHLAEMRIEVWYDLNGQIDEIKVLQDTEVIDRSSLSITHQKSKCQEKDTEAKCDVTSMSAVFLEPLKDKVMAIKAMDFKLRDQTTYLNDGFDISGDSLNPMATEMIPSPLKGEGLIKVTQNEKYSDYWTTDDGRIFEKNSFGSFKQINFEFKRFQDSGEAKTRLHSDFDEVIQSEAKRAANLFDATKLKSELPDSFSYDISISERITDKVIQEMIIQEHIAQKKMQELYDKQTRWN